jgi:hypothetical protein
MYRPSDPQLPLYDAGGLLPEEKRVRCEKTWAGVFRRHALAILRRVEDEFAELFHPELGRPNRPVELVLGVLILKEIQDLTDDEALERLEFDALWWWALQREFSELHLCQKTLHNFREGLLGHQKAKVAFRRVTDELIGELGVKVGRQRLDSTQVLSNIAILSRLRKFCETVRLFLGGVQRAQAGAYEGLPERMRGRYEEESRYADAKKEQVRRRLGVVARDVWRLIQRFQKDQGVTRQAEWTLLKRLFEEQCRVVTKAAEPEEGDDDQGEAGAPVEVKEPSEIGGETMQTPHDPQVTYSGHKGQGYSVQVAETCERENEVNLLTDVEVTPAWKGDWKQTVPAVQRLEAAGHKPEEVVADTQFGGGENAAELGKRGVNLLAPVPGQTSAKPQRGTCPPPAAKCPQEEKEALEWLRRQEASPEFPKRYAIRAGIEATNSELKRAHGMKKLRVRGEARVKLAVYFKALACNIKRALRAWEARLRVQAQVIPAAV